MKQERTMVGGQEPAHFFHAGIQRNLQYWQDWLNHLEGASAAIDEERDNILRAIAFAFTPSETWQAVYNLVMLFSPYMERQGFWQTWSQLLEQAVSAARRVADQVGEANLLIKQALMFQRQNRFQEAVAYYREALVQARHIQDDYLIARVLTNLGYLYTESGYWHRAEILCCRALVIFQQCGRPYGWAHAENHLGILYTRMGLWTQAEDHLEEACSIWKRSRDDHGLLRGYINFSLLYLSREQPEQALMYLERALEQADRTSDMVERGVIYSNMAIAHRLLGDLPMSEKLNRQAERVYQQQSNLAGMARVWGNLGILYIQQSDWPAAASYLDRSLKTWQSLGSRLGEIESLLGLIEYELARNQPQPGLQRLMEVEALLRSIGGAGRNHPYQERVEDYRRRLTGPETDQTAAD